MADAKKCDRCGKLFEVQKSYNGVPVFTKLVFFYESSISSSIYDKTRMDLCPDCENSFDDWLHPYSFEENEEEKEIKYDHCRDCKNVTKNVFLDPCKSCDRVPGSSNNNFEKEGE